MLEYNKKNMRLIDRPDQGEYPEYANMYINLVPADCDLLEHLNHNFSTVKNFILSLPKELLLSSYAKGKWSIKEVLVHIIDDERIYAYRAMCFARGERKKLPGFEQDDYAFYSGAQERDINDIMDEYEAVRRATITLFNGLSNEALQRSGIADENYFSVRALAYHIAGHELHHINIIKQKYV